MVRGWLARHKSLVVTATSGAVVAALITTVAVTSGGYTAQRLDLADPAVWVANAAQQYVGRANTEVKQLDTVVPVAGSQPEVVQSGSTVIAVDRADARADIVDPATAQIVKTVPLPPQQPSVYIAGGNVAVYAQGSGELWVMPIESFSTYDADQQATLNLGAGSVVSVDDAGMLYAYSADVYTVSRVDLAAGGASVATATSSLHPGDGDRLTVTSVARHWAVLDATTNAVEVDGAIVDLAPLIGADGSPVLQAASSTGSSLVISWSGGLVSVPFSGGAADLTASGHSGASAPPLVLGGCVYAAWTDGSALRNCSRADQGDTALRLAEVRAGARLAFVHSAGRVLLNDSNAGSSWAVQSDAQLIDNWTDLIDDDQHQDVVRPDDDSTDTVVQKDQQPPVAIADELGARPGRSTTLAVLINDYDPNGDVLVVESIDGLDPSEGTVDLIDERQQVQLTLPATASGVIDFTYSISDGRGGTDSAHVRVTVRETDENSAPLQVRTTRATVEAGGQGSFDVLGDWIDPDGDPFYLTSATVQQPDSAGFGPEGTVVVRPSPATLGRVAVALVVSDGTDQGTGSAAVTVAPAGSVPIVADPFVVLATAGQEITIAPLEHVRGGSATVTLNAVPPRSGVTITPSYDAGTFRFQSKQVRTHYIDYVVTDGVSTVTGTVRVDVSAALDAGSTPITVPKTVFVRTLNSATVNVAATDIDPAGGVLLVTGIETPPSRSGVDTAVLNQATVRVTLTAVLDGPVTFDYTVTNGLAAATGTITVIEVPAPAVVQPPIARDDSAMARVGDAIVIDVLANDEQPDGLDISLDQHLVEGLSGESGLLFASGSVLRYLAPDHPGNFTAVYQVTGSDGQTAQAQLRIEVREARAETNNPPVPQTVTARVLAGQSVRIDIPLTGIDPDGDSVQLLGQETNPQKGAVTETGATYLQYSAGDYSAGTDSFSYTVVDALGARATGTVKVGIAARPAGARNPVASADEVIARPRTAVSVQVLANDSDPDGGTLQVVAAVPTDDDTKAVVEDGAIVTITPPTGAVDGTTFSVLYTISNPLGGTSQNFVTVTLSSTAPLSYPVATDTVLTLSDVQGRTTIDVDVLQNVFFADGPSSELGLRVLDGYGSSADVTATKKVRVTVGPTNQLIPFAVTHPGDPGIVAYALIRVPGVADALPQLADNVPPLTVVSGQPLTIDLDRYVVAARGRGVRITDSSTVQATHADGSALVANDHTLRFVSAPKYSGPASISFEVTDGTSVSDPVGRTATLVLAITVTQRDNAPPVFDGAVIEFEPGQQKEIDLVKLTTYPHPDDVDQLVYSAVAPLPTGFTYEVRDQKLTIRAAQDAVVGSKTGITMSVRDSTATGQSGRIALTVVSSTRPLVHPASDVALTRRGDTTSIDVLANDESTNPFPGKPLRVVAITGADGDALPAGISVTAAAGGSIIKVTVAKDASPTDVNLQYQVADATKDPDRYAFGSVRISVQDVPDSPAAPQRQADQLVGGELKLRITPPQQNNSAITGYSIVSSSHGAYEQDCGLSLICSLGGLIVGEPYRFAVVATNGVGSSSQGPVSDPYTVDYKPAAPTSVLAEPSSAALAPGGRSITVSWPTVPDPTPGTAITGYTVTVTGAGVTFVARDVSSPFTTTAGGALANDANYTVSVYARNSAQVLSDSEWRRQSTSVHTVGPPSVPDSGPTATLTGVGGQIRVTWGDSAPNGAGSVSYSVGRFSGAADTPTCSTGDGKPATSDGAVGVSSGWVDQTAQDGASYTYVVYADNGIYCTAAASGVIESKQPPSAATGAVVVQYRDGVFDLRVTAISAGGTVSRYEVRLGGSGSWRAVAVGDWLTSREDSSVYGTAQSVSFRACRDATESYCGAESGPATATPFAVRATVTSCVTGGSPTIVKPANGGTVTISYRLAYNVPEVNTDPVDPEDPDLPVEPAVYAWSGYDYSESDTVPSEANGVRIKAVVIDGNSYDDPDPQENVCTAP